MQRFLPLLFLTGLALFGCSNDPAQSTAADTDAGYSTSVKRTDEAGKAVDAQLKTQYDNTIAAVQANSGDVTALPGAAAISNIDTWIELLDDKSEASPLATTKVTANLKELKTALGQPNINGPLVGLLLTTLAVDARQVAGDETDLDPLVAALEAGGNKLTGATITGDDLLSQTLLVGKQFGADLTTVPAAAARGNINSWIAKLRAMPGTDDLVEELEELKTELTATDIDGDEVGEILLELAEETGELAPDNNGLQALAYLLRAGGRRLQADD